MEIHSVELVMMDRDDFSRAAAWLALIATGQISDYDLRRMITDAVYEDGDAKKMQLRMQQKMAEIMKEVNAKRTEGN